MKKYTHVVTGSMDTQEGWMSSYDPQELNVRNLTAEEAFEEDKGKTLFEVEISKAAAAMGRKGGSSKSEAKKRTAAENGKKSVKTFYLLSGAGEMGTWSGPIRTNDRGIQMRAKKERCNGDRFCSVWELVPASDTHREHIRCEDGDMRETPNIK